MEREKLGWKKGFREGRKVVGPASNPQGTFVQLEKDALQRGNSPI